MVQGLSRVVSESDSDRSELFVSKWNVPQEMGRRKSGLVQGGRGMQLWSVADARLCTQGVVCRVSCVVLATLSSALLVPTYFSSIRQLSMVGWNRVCCEVLWLGLRESTESASGIIEMTAARLPNCHFGFPRIAACDTGGASLLTSAMRQALNYEPLLTPTQPRNIRLHS
jgi:hypothetical protein